MSRKEIVRVLAIYFCIAAVASAIELLATPGMAGLRWAAVAGDFVGGIGAWFLLPGILPLLYWAFRRFRGENAAGPIIIWGVLGATFLILSTVGRAYDGDIAFSQIPVNIGSFFENDNQAFVREAKLGCVETQNKNRYPGNTPEQIDRYCQCTAETLLNALTVSEFTTAMNARSTTLPPWMQQKAVNAGISCRRLVYGR
jgi:hypothetical protein